MLILIAAAGCGGDAGMELAASDAMVAVADQMQVTVEEYHAEVSRFDDTREDGMVSAFVTRVQAEHEDAAAMEANVKEFQAAMRKVRQDRETEWRRRSAAIDNVQVLREMSRGMQKLALESLSLRDEMRRYLESWIANRQRAERGTATKVTAAGEQAGTK
jgi:hypothetical protein